MSDPTGTLSTRRLRISGDGKTLTETTEVKRKDGSKGVRTVTYQRESGDAQGLVGRWKAVGLKIETPASVTYEVVGANGLKFSNDVGVTYTVMLDGKPVPVVGPAVLPGSMIAAKAIDDTTMEFTMSREGVVTGKSVRRVSADGKTLTVTFTSLGPNASKEPTIIVFTKSGEGS